MIYNNIPIPRKQAVYRPTLICAISMKHIKRIYGTCKNGLTKYLSPIYNILRCLECTHTVYHNYHQKYQYQRLEYCIRISCKIKLKRHSISLFYIVCNDIVYNYVSLKLNICHLHNISSIVNDILCKPVYIRDVLYLTCMNISHTYIFC